MSYKLPLILLLGLFTTLVTISCGEDSDTPITPALTTPSTPVTTSTEPSTLDLTTVRKNIATNLAISIIIPAYENLKVHTDQLSNTIEIFNTDPTEANLVTAQTALKESWLAWQSASIYMFGPAESVALRKSLNTYPTDVTQITTNIQTGDYILSSLANQAAVGFPAVDYLLNGLATDNANIIERYKGQADGRKQYLADVANDIKTRVDQSLNGWTIDGENYAATFTEDNALGIDIGSSLSIIVNAIDLHFQRFVRDGKVAIPAGIRSAGVPRPKAIEALYGSYSVELLKESLSAYEKMFMGIGANGIDGAGLFDYLVAIDAEDLAIDIQAQFDMAQLAANNLSDPLADQIDTDLDAMTNVFIEMQKVVVLIKSDMASLMGISITNQDNDGD